MLSWGPVAEEEVPGCAAAATASHRARSRHDGQRGTGEPVPRRCRGLGY